MPRSARLRLDDIALSIRDIESLLSGLRSLEEYVAKRHTKLALERAVELVSEASRYLSDEMKALAPEIPWRAVADIGNHLRHGYAGVSDSLMWNLPVHEIPRLKAAIARIDAAFPAQEN